MQKQQLYNNNVSRGFTIVELLIIIVVIAILAAISVVAYNGVQQRAHDSTATNMAQQAGRKIVAYHALEGRYPDDLEEADLSGIEDSLEYDVNNTADPVRFCVTATSNSSSFYVSSTQRSPREGGCPGHSVGGEPVVITLAEWNFTNPGQSADMIASGVDVLPMTAQGLNANEWNVNPPPNYTTAPVLRIASNRTEPGTSTGSMFVQLTINASNSSAVLDLDELAFVGARGGGSLNRGVFMRSNHDNYGSDVFSEQFSSRRPNWQSYTVDLSGLPSANTHTLRIYPYGDGNPTSSVELDNLVLSGRVLTN